MERQRPSHAAREAETQVRVPLQPDPRLPASWSSTEIRETYGEFWQAVDNDSIKLDSQWTPEFREIIKAYLAERNPRQQLAEIRTSLEAIRDALAETFTLGDVLLKVGDSKFA